MSASPVEPVVELFVGEGAGKYASWAKLANTTEEVLEESLLAARAFVIREVTTAMRNDPALKITASVLRNLVGVAWAVYSPSFARRATPMVANAYIQGFRDVRADRVDMTIINGLAEQHVQRLGKYFNETSSEAMTQGFNTYVNRKVPARAAAEKTLQAYGLTPRQMSGLTSLKDAEKIESARPRNTERKVKEYIGAAIKRRFKIFASQEAHNLNAQASQVAWMYMVDAGKMPREAEKIWITAHDERVCPVCGPLHAQVVGVTEQFTSPTGEKIWVPGLHVNCRCVVRLRHPLKNFTQPRQVSKALYGISYAMTESNLPWKEDEHPRHGDGRFRPKNQPGTNDRTKLGVKDRGIDQQFAQLVGQVKSEAKAPSAALLREMTSNVVPDPSALGVRSIGGPIGAAGFTIAAAAPAKIEPKTEPIRPRTDTILAIVEKIAVQGQELSLTDLTEVNPEADLDAQAQGHRAAAAATGTAAGAGEPLWGVMEDYNPDYSHPDRVDSRWGVGDDLPMEKLSKDDENQRFYGGQDARQKVLDAALMSVNQKIAGSYQSILEEAERDGTKVMVGETDSAGEDVGVYFTDADGRRALVRGEDLSKIINAYAMGDLASDAPEVVFSEGNLYPSEDERAEVVDAATFVEKHLGLDRSDFQVTVVRLETPKSGMPPLEVKTQQYRPDGWATVIDDTALPGRDSDDGEIPPYLRVITLMPEE